MTETPVDELMEELLACSDSDLDGRVRSLELERRRVEAELALTAGEIDRRKSHLDDGHRSLKAYLRATCSHSDAEAARIARLATVASRVSGVAEALHAGRVGTPQVNELAVAHANPRVRSRLGEFAPMLLELAERLSFREFRVCVQRFMVLADLDGAHRDLDESIRTRRARVVNLDGSLHLDAAGGDPLVNVELEAIFQIFCELEYEADVAARRAEHGALADAHALPRTPAQRGYDAIVSIMRGALANHGAGRAAPAAEPLVNILTDHRTFGAVLAEFGLATDTTLAGEPVDPFTGLASPNDLLAELLADPATLTARRCETTTGQVLHPHAVLRAALAGHVRRVVLGSTGLPVDLGRRSRVFTGAAREAAKLLVTHCDHLGCSLPADLCEVDHSTEWHEDGRTDQDNAGVECGDHNRHKHRKRWRTRRDIHGRVHTIRVDGTLMLPVGVRPPVFPDEDTDAERPSALGAISPDLERIIDGWVDHAADDVERRCRSLRRTAIHHASAHDGLDVRHVLRNLTAWARTDGGRGG